MWWHSRMLGRHGTRLPSCCTAKIRESARLAGNVGAPGSVLGSCRSPILAASTEPVAWLIAVLEQGLSPAGQQRIGWTSCYLGAGAAEQVRAQHPQHTSGGVALMIDRQDQLVRLRKGLSAALPTRYAWKCSW